MSATTEPRGLASALKQAADAARLAGLDRDGELAAISQFAEGPAVITVAEGALGRAAPVLPLIAVAGTGAAIERVPLSEVTTPALRDLLVVVTPADRALSLAETEVVRSAREHGYAAALAVVDTDAFGDGDDRALAIGEIEALRIRPALAPLGVPWFFLGTPAAESEFTSLVSAASACLHSSHEQAGLAVLREVANSMLGDIAPHLAAHAEQAALLSKASTDLVALRARLEQEAQLTVLSVRTALQGAEQDVYTAGLAVPARFAALPASPAASDLAGAAAPLRLAWDGCLELAGEVVERARTRFAGELTRLDPTALAGQPPDPIAGLSPSWETVSLRQALTALDTTDLAGLLGELRPLAGLAAKDAGDESLIGRISARIRRYDEDKQADVLPERFNASLIRTLSLAMGAVIPAATAAATAGAATDTEAALQAFTQRLADRSTALAGQECWQAAHDMLARLTPGPAAAGGADGD